MCSNDAGEPDHKSRVRQEGVLGADKSYAGMTKRSHSKASAPIGRGFLHRAKNGQSRWTVSIKLVLLNGHT